MRCRKKGKAKLTRNGLRNSLINGQARGSDNLRSHEPVLELRERVNGAESVQRQMANIWVDLEHDGQIKRRTALIPH